jgi:hypothetical protein
VDGRDKPGHDDVDESEPKTIGMTSFTANDVPHLILICSRSDSQMFPKATFARERHASPRHVSHQSNGAIRLRRNRYDRAGASSKKFRFGPNDDSPTLDKSR